MSALILIVDDLEANLSLLQAQLDAEYFSVVKASSGEEALQLVYNAHPDLILLDVMMPGINGFEVCQKLRSDPTTCHIPIMMLTAHGESHYRTRGFLCGADDFLVKPISEQVLLARVENLTRLKHELDELRLRKEMGQRLGLLRGLTSFDDMLLKEKGRILMFEDRPLLLQTLAHALEPEFHMDSVTHSDVFFQKMNQTHYDFFIVSLMLKNVDGLRICSQLRRGEETRYTPILAMLDNIDPIKLSRAFRMGVNDCICRPIDNSELILRCRTQLRRSRYQHYLRHALDYGIESGALDPLTGLHNRRYMEARLENAVNVALPQKIKTAVALFDLDYFKHVNDTYGHNVGDSILQQFTQCIQNNVRMGGIFGRWGGEEFLLILDNMSEKSAYALCQRLCIAIAHYPFRILTHQILELTVSIGLTFVALTDTAETLFKRTDQALYQAKQAGRNQVNMIRAPKKRPQK